MKIDIGQLLLLAKCLFSFGWLSAQVPQVVWTQTFGGSLADKAFDVKVLPDGGFIICGSTNSYDGNVSSNYGGTDAWLIRTDPQGNLLWQKNYGGSGEDMFHAILPLADGSFLACGATTSSDGDIAVNLGGKDVWIVRVTNNGQVLWSKTFGGSHDEQANDVASSGDTLFIAVGHTFSSDGQIEEYKDLGDAWLVYVDIEGNFLKQKTKGGSAFDEFQSIKRTSNDGFILAGTSFSNNGTVSGNQGGSDAWIARLSKVGAEQWNFLYGTTLDEGAVDVFENESGHFVFLGYQSNGFSYDLYLAESDPNGTLVIANTINGDSVLWPASLTQAQTKGTLLAATASAAQSSTTNCGVGFSDMTIAKVDENLLQWQLCLGGSQDDVVSQLLSHGQQQITLVGYSQSADGDIPNNQGNWDVVLMQLVDGCGVTAAFDQVINGPVVSFENKSKEALFYFWTFGDGNSSTEMHPTHMYGNSGTYNVCLVAQSACTTDTFCTQIVIVCQPAEAAFSYVQTDLTVTFSASAPYVTDWQWTFGDGGSGSGSTVAHTYAAPGQYAVCLVASNFCSADTLCETITVTCPTVVAGFTYVINDLTVTFTSTSTNATKWKWSFGDGKKTGQQNPTHIYNAAGTYEVCLIAGNLCASDTLCLPITVGCTLPQASFLFATNELTVGFTNTSSDATSWLWDFGDGNTSTLAQPVHTYSQSGTYEVCLTAFNDCGDNTYCTQITVVCLLPQAAFTVALNNLEAAFTNLSVNATAWLWQFGDGNTSTTQQPVYTYAAPGNYEVCLTATNTCGDATYCAVITVLCPPFEAAFTFSIVDNVVQFEDASAGSISWLWDFGDGAFSNLQNPTHVYAAPGMYYTCLETSDGCSVDTSCAMVHIVAVTTSAMPAGNAVRLFPNPSVSYARLLLYDVHGSVQVLVKNLVGGVVHKATFDDVPNQRILLDLRDLPSGVYTIEVVNDKINWSGRLVLH